MGQSIRDTELFRMDYSDGSFIAAILDKKPNNYYGDIISIYNSDTVMRRRVDNKYWSYAEIVDVPIMDFDEFLELNPVEDSVTTLLYDTLGNVNNTVITFFSYWEGKWRVLTDIQVKDYDLYDSFECYKSGRYYFAELDDITIAKCELIIDDEKFDGDHLNTVVLADKKYLKRAKSLKFKFIAYDMNGNEVYNESHTIKYLKKGKFMLL